MPRDKLKTAAAIVTQPCLIGREGHQVLWDPSNLGGVRGIECRAPSPKRQRGRDTGKSKSRSCQTQKTGSSEVLLPKRSPEFLGALPISHYGGSSLVLYVRCCFIDPHLLPWRGRRKKGVSPNAPASYSILSIEAGPPSPSVPLVSCSRLPSFLPQPMATDRPRRRCSVAVRVGPLLCQARHVSIAGAKAPTLNSVFLRLLGRC